MPAATRRRTISATEAAKNFGRIVDAVRETRTDYIVERGRIAVARISPVTEPSCSGADFVRILRALPAAGDAYLSEVMAESRRRNRPAVPKDPWAS